MNAYNSLKKRLLHEFPADAKLQRGVAMANSLDEILAAVAESYRDSMIGAARAASGQVPNLGGDTQEAEYAAFLREFTLLEIMTFFERDHAGTATVEVRRTGPDGLRVIRRGPSDDGDLAESRVAGRAFPNGAPCAAYQNRKEAS